MAIRWTAAALEARLEALEQKHRGQELVDAVVSFADTLEDEDKRLLQDVLLARARRDSELGADDSHWTDHGRRRLFRRGPAPKRRWRM